MRFVTKPDVAARFDGKTVAIVGSGPGVLENPRGFIDRHDIVVRVNNYRLSRTAGHRTDVFYSFFGHSIKKSVRELKRDGVTLCMCKCPDAAAIDSDWHRANGRLHGIDFRWIYQRRQGWWFCDTYVPALGDFQETFHLLGGRVPTTGFSAIRDILSCNPRAVYLTGFDGFRSGIHNVSERWRPGNPADPIAHAPERELKWLADNLRNYPVTTDRALGQALETFTRSAA